jgi:DNA-binding transcriptional ArsR family regulator
MMVARRKTYSKMEGLSEQALGYVAEYFQTLSEPMRLRILNTLRSGERNVGDLTELCGCSMANVSRHLAALAKQGMVVREGRGTSVYYRIADESIYSLCDLVCTHIARQFEQRANVQRSFESASRS